MVNLRFLRHLLTSDFRTRRVFDQEAFDRIEAAIHGSESRHRGEVRFAVEAGLDPMRVLRGQSARERAVEVFSTLHIWDTAENNGVLIYLLLADRDVEIVADRGIHAHVAQGEWEEICHAMEARFREGAFVEGVTEGIDRISALLERHYPKAGGDVDELPNRPVML